MSNSFLGLRDTPGFYPVNQDTVLTPNNRIGLKFTPFIDMIRRAGALVASGVNIVASAFRNNLDNTITTV